MTTHRRLFRNSQQQGPGAPRWNPWLEPGSRAISLRPRNGSQVFPLPSTATISPILFSRPSGRLFRVWYPLNGSVLWPPGAGCANRTALASRFVFTRHRTMSCARKQSVMINFPLSVSSLLLLGVRGASSRDRMAGVGAIYLPSTVRRVSCGTSLLFFVSYCKSLAGTHR